MTNTYDFEEIRPFRDNEIHEKLMGLVKEPILLGAIPKFFPEIPVELFIEKLKNIKSVQEFQSEIMGNLLLKGLEEKTTNGVEIKGYENIQQNEGYLYISNHRDIILDSAFLNYKLISINAKLTEIAIGDNLLIFPWIKDLVRINRNFIVHRDVPVRQMLEISKRLSAYMRDTLKNRKQPIWIAQREGRAKDSDDRTQEALLKMLNMSGENNPVENFNELNICPLSISYEYDPCDYLKAKEFQLKRDNPDFKKEPKDDLLNMITGMQGFKGKVVFHLTGCLNPSLEKIKTLSTNKNEQIKLIAAAIDKQIHLYYEIFKGNMVAFDLLNGEQKFSNQYNGKDKATFETYLRQQVDKIDLPNKDEAFLRKKILEMYANPLINKLKAEKDII